MLDKHLARAGVHRTVFPVTIGQIAVLCGLAASVAVAQPPRLPLDQQITRYNYSSTTDVYGNVRPLDLSRRPVGLFQNEVQRQALRVYQEQGRRLDRRGGYRPFSLPGDVLKRARLTLEYSLANVLVPNGTPGRWRGVLPGYGSFDENPERSLGTAAGAYQRRYSLIGATGLNAPVHRALERVGGSQRGRSILVPTTAPSRAQQDAAFLQPQVPGTTLIEQLETRAHRAGSMARAEAWLWFRDGEYTRAARAFEGATAVDPQSREARIGELFCYLSMGRTQTAVVVLRQMLRRGGNVFLNSLDLTAKYGDRSQARQVRTQLSLLAARSDSHPDVRALSVLALWYLDEQGEALRVARDLARDFPRTAYAGWPEQIHEAPSGRAAPNHNARQPE